MLGDSSDEDLGEDLNALDLNLDFKHAAASQERFERLFFPKNFPGANSRERLAHLMSITREVEGTLSLDIFLDKTELISWRFFLKALTVAYG